MINSNEISVVVQGAIDKENTPKCLKSIRKVFPQAEIILSTWEGANVEGLDYDEVIFNKDPGGVKDPFVPTFTNNLLRQMVSTKSGVKKAGRKQLFPIFQYAFAHGSLPFVKCAKNWNLWGCPHGQCEPSPGW